MADEAPVVLFDGTCNFCDGAVHFMVDHERGSTLKFAALQSDAGSALLDRSTTPEEAKLLRAGVSGEGDPDSVVLIENGRLYSHSTAALRIARYMRWPYSWLQLGWLVPRFLRDAVYRWFARHRYRWFGKTEACRVPTPELRARFL
jgi:predicted DCC family thiol-disulfide oxidoreductase YuxK